MSLPRHGFVSSMPIACCSSGDQILATSHGQTTGESPHGFSHPNNLSDDFVPPPVVDSAGGEGCDDGESLMTGGRGGAGRSMKLMAVAELERRCEQYARQADTKLQFMLQTSWSRFFSILCNVMALVASDGQPFCTNCVKTVEVCAPTRLCCGMTRRTGYTQAYLLAEEIGSPTLPLVATNASVNLR